MRQSKSNKKRETTASLYLRLSRDDNLEGESYSIGNQKKLLTKVAKEKGYTNLLIYIDEHVIIGTSGENLVKSRGSALVPISFLLRDKPKSFKSLKIINERI